MQALWLSNQQLRPAPDRPRPAPGPGEALVRVLVAGICNTDIELTRGYYPYDGIPGHEFVGLVEQGPPDLQGRRVVGEINAACGACQFCRAGLRTHCPRRTVLGIVGRDGAFAEHLVLPAENLHPVPDNVPTDAAAFTEPLAAALEIQQQVPLRPAQRVLVVGDGKLGQLVAQTLALSCSEIHVAGRHASKLALLAARGIHVIPLTPDPSPQGEGETAALSEGVPGRSFDVAVECTGDPGGFALARRALRPRGTLVLKSTYAGALSLDAAAIVVDELTLVGSRCGPFAPALRLLAERRVDVLPLIHARYRLADGLAAFEHAQRPGVLKVLLDVAGGTGDK